jgi:hypothetical protein
MRLVNFLRENSFSAAIRTKVETNFPDSIRTSQKRIKESELRIRSAVNKIFLSEANKQERLRFAFQHINNVNFWENVVFSDEKTFQSCSNGRVRVYRPVGERFSEQYVHKIKRTGRFTVNVWG